MIKFADFFGKEPLPQTYQVPGVGDANDYRVAKQRYNSLKDNFLGVKASYDPVSDDLTVVGPLVPVQEIILAKMKRAAIKMNSKVLLAVFNFSQMPVRLVFEDVQSIGGSGDAKIFRELRPWTLPVDAGVKEAESFDKTLLAEMAQAINNGQAFVLKDAGMLPGDIQTKNDQLLEALINSKLGDKNMPGVKEMKNI